MPKLILLHAFNIIFVVLNTFSNVTVFEINYLKCFRLIARMFAIFDTAKSFQFIFDS